MTIAGDLAQATSAWSPESWDDVAGWASLGEDAKYSELRLGYRVPEEVMLYAGRLLPSAAPRTDLPRSFRRSGLPEVIRAEPTALPSAIVSAVEKATGQGGSVAVICGPTSYAYVERALDDAGVDARVVEDDEAKGLEFDRVVVVEPSVIARDGPTGLRRRVARLRIRIRSASFFSCSGS